MSAGVGSVLYAEGQFHGQSNQPLSARSPLILGGSSGGVGTRENGAKIDGHELSMINAIRIQHLERIVSKLMSRDERIDSLLSQGLVDSEAMLDITTLHGLFRADSMCSLDSDSLEEVDLDHLFDSNGKMNEMKTVHVHSDQKISIADQLTESRQFVREKPPRHGGPEDILAEPIEAPTREFSSQDPQFPSKSQFQFVQRGPASLGPMPGLVGDDLIKWEHLSFQLHLPFHVVKFVVEAKLKDRTYQLNKIM